MGEVITNQDYPFDSGVPGQEVQWQDGRKFIYAYFDAGTLSPATAARGSVLVVSYDTGSNKRHPIMIGVATSAIYRKVGVAMAAITAAGWYWFQTAGDAQVLCDGTPTDITVGLFLECLNNTDSLIVDGSPGTTRSVLSIAVAKEAYATNAEAVKNVWLIGDRVNFSAT